MIQQNLACNQTVENSFISTQIEAENNTESLNNIIMTDKSVRCVLVFKEKKLAKKSFEKLLILFMK